MFRFIHSADWQLGARFKQFGAKGDVLRNARLETLRRALELGRKHSVDAFFIAGDLFEDNQVDERLVATVVELFREFPSFPVYLLPGNHDPFTGADSVWRRKAFLHPPSNVHLLIEEGVTKLGSGMFLLASPLQQKVSTVDPSLKLDELAASLPKDAIKVGLTHGALKIEGKHQPNDFPIALNAASRAGLDYLGIGHWHNWLVGTDGGRVVMPGTPEPDQFDQERSGNVALVEIAGAGQSPHVQALPVATLTWKTLAYDFLAEESARASLEQALAALLPNAPHTILRVTLSGTASPNAVADLRTWLGPATAPFLVCQIADATRVALGPAELQDLRARHPILAQVLADIDALEIMATGSAGVNVATGDATPDETSATPAWPPLTLAAAQSLLAPAKIDLAALTPEFFSQLRQITFQTLQEVAK